MKRSDDDDRNLRPVVVALAAGACCLGVLAWNAAVRNVWEDEAHGNYYLARLPLATLLRLLRTNVAEDPPLFLMIAHFWARCVGPRPLALRAMPIAFWAATLLGLWRAGRLLAGTRAAGAAAVVAAAAMPYHWLYPAAFTWYSFFAALAAWSFVAVLELLRSADPKHPRPVRWLVAYALLAAAMPYVNYIAPGFFAAHLLVVWLLARKGNVAAFRRCVGMMGIAWAFVLLAYLPWMPVLLRQLSVSVHHPSLSGTALSVFVMLAGESINPLRLWQAAAVAIWVMALVALLALRSKRQPHVLLPPLAVFALLLVLLLLSGTTWTKRMLLVSPFLALAAGVALAEAGGRKLKAVVLAAWILAASVAAARLAVGTGWSSYRWLDPFRQAVADARELAAGDGGDPIVQTDSSSAMFYLGDDIGMFRAELALYAAPIRGWPVPADAAGRDRLQQRLAAAPPAAIACVHTNATHPWSDSRASFDELLAPFGYRLDDARGMLEVAPEFLAHHPEMSKARDPLDRYRIVVAKYVRTASPSGR
jgi:hypothetical protein